MAERIHPTAIVDPKAKLGDGVEIGPWSRVGPDVTLGDGVVLQSSVVVEGVTDLGAGCVVHPFAVLGGPPQHMGHKGEPTRLSVGARTIVREHVTMHCGTMFDAGHTRVGEGCLFMACTHVAHDCVVGDGVVVANFAGLAGHARVDDHVFIGGQAGVHQRTRVGRYAFVGAQSMVGKDVIPYGSVYGNHAHLEGLNLVGLKRRGFKREQIHEMRAAYRALFADEGAFSERLEDAEAAFGHNPEVAEIISFIRAAGARPLCLPHG